jgi:transcriptional regulator with XRE-family HTH domain
MHELSVRFGRNVRCTRRALKHTQTFLAKRSGVQRQAICDIERGLRNPTLLTISLLAAGLEVEPAELLRDA